MVKWWWNGKEAMAGIAEPRPGGIYRVEYLDSKGGGTWTLPAHVAFDTEEECLRWAGVALEEYRNGK